MSVQRSINYTRKDFSGFKEQLLDFAKNYFPDSYTDFTVPSPGTMFLEMAAYVGDILAFYQDVQVQETFLKYAKNPANLYAMAYMMGYRPKVTSVAEAELTFVQYVPAVREEHEVEESGSVVTKVEFHPDWDKLLKIEEYSEIRCVAVENVKFLLRDAVDFSFSSSYDPTEIFVGEVNQEGEPLFYEFYKKGIAFSGEVQEQNFHFDEYQKFRTVTLKENNIIGIVSIKDVENGEEWVEVPALGQDTVFRSERVENREEALKEGTSYILKLQKVDRRFVTRFNVKGDLEIQFGAGMYAEDSDESNFLPNPISLQPGTQDFVDRFDLAYDPSNFLFSKSYGLAPINRTLKVTYLTGGGLSANVPAHSLTEYDLLRITNTSTGNPVDVDDLTISYVDDDGRVITRNALEFWNGKPASGGRSGDTPEEIRENAIRSFAEQKRVVTLNDFNVRALSMPQKFGSIAKVHAINEPLTDVELSALLRNPLAITLYVLSQDAEGHLITTSDLVKNNLRTYLSEYMMITDAIDIKDAFIINLGINYDVVLRPGVQTRDVLTNCNLALQDYLHVSKRFINEPINLSDMYTLLDQVEGVQTVQNITLKNLTRKDNSSDGRYTYSNYAYGISVAMRNNILYPSYDPCIFEVKYPETDILGRAVTL